MNHIKDAAKAAVSYDWMKNICAIILYSAEPASEQHITARLRDLRKLQV